MEVPISFFFFFWRRRVGGGRTRIRERVVIRERIKRETGDPMPEGSGGGDGGGVGRGGERQKPLLLQENVAFVQVWGLCFLRKFYRYIHVL